MVFLTLSFGLGLAIKVNAIVGLPTFRTWKLILDLDTNQLVSKNWIYVLTCVFNMPPPGYPLASHLILQGLLDYLAQTKLVLYY